MIEIREAVKTYGEVCAADGVSFVAPAGKVTALLGPNGAGKTTTMRLLLGLARPDAGEALIEGSSYDQLTDPRRTVGAALDSMGFHPGRSGRNHLHIVVRAAGLDPSRVDAVLEIVGLSAAADRRAGSYSRGMQQRLALAAALLGDPRVMVLDEPTIGLDPAGIAWLRDMMRGWAADGKTVLVSSHLLAEVSLVADRVVIINGGRVLLEEDAVALGGPAAAVSVRSPEAIRLLAACKERGWQAEASGPDRLTIHDVKAEEVGRLAAEHGFPVYALSEEMGTGGLEELFLELTDAGQEVLS